MCGKKTPKNKANPDDDDNDAQSLDQSDPSFPSFERFGFFSCPILIFFLPFYAGNPFLKKCKIPHSLPQVTQQKKS